MGSVDGFFAYARERYQIHLKKKLGRSPPWTEDQVLASGYFCNVFREDDKTTVWFREHVRNPLRNNCIRVIYATVAFRWFNRIETGMALLPHLLSEGYSRPSFENVLGDLHNQGKQIFTGAFIINSEPGKLKYISILDCLDQLFPEIVMRVAESTSLQEAHGHLMRVSRLGPFMAYEVVTDLRHTTILSQANDIYTWASAGPGAARGLHHVFGCGVLSYGSQGGQKEMLSHMANLLSLSKKPNYWPHSWPAWEMREVEHTLCEYDKYERFKAGGRLKRKYNVCS